MRLRHPHACRQFAIIVRSLAHFSDYVWVLSTTLALIICVGFDHSTRSPLSHPAHSTATPPVLTGHITHTHRPFQHIPPLDLARSRATQHALTTSRFFCGAGTGCGSRLPFLCGCTPPRSRPPRVSRTSCSARGSGCSPWSRTSQPPTFHPASLQPSNLTRARPPASQNTRTNPTVTRVFPEPSSQTLSHVDRTWDSPSHLLLLLSMLRIAKRNLFCLMLQHRPTMSSWTL